MGEIKIMLPVIIHREKIYNRNAEVRGEGTRNVIELSLKGRPKRWIF